MVESEKTHNFSSVALFMPGHTTWSGVEGTLSLIGGELSFVDDSGLVKFKLGMGSIEVVDFHNPGLIVIKAKSSETYKVFPTIRTMGIQRAYYTPEGARNAKEWERVLVKYVPIIPCTGTPRSYLAIFFTIIGFSIIVPLFLVVLLSIIN